MHHPTQSDLPPTRLEDVLITEELARRPTRPTDHAAEARALAALGEALATEPQTVLQKVADIALTLCRTDSAGVSILEPGGDVFRWRAIAGAFAPNLGGTVPRAASPCGIVLERDAASLFAYPERYFAYSVATDLPFAEVLLVPFHAGGQTGGMVWAIAHTVERKFDAEDARLLTSLARFAAAAHHTCATTEALQKREERQAFLLQLHDTLRSLADPVAIQVEAARTLGKHLGVNRAFYCEVEPDEDHVIIRRNYTDGVADMAGRYRIADFGAFLGEQMRAGRTIVSADGPAEPRVSPAERRSYAAVDLRAYVGVPLVKGGRLVSILTVHQTRPRAWTADELNLIDETAERTWAAVERARAEAALRQSEDRFRRYFELGLIGMAITSPEQELLEVNDEICRILGYTRDELLYKTWLALSHPDDVAADSPQFNQVLAGTIDGYTREKRWVRKGGRVIDGTISVRCVRRADGAVDYFVALLRDITERKRLENDLRDADRRKDEFLAMLGHELRNPLVPLRGVTETLRRQQRDSSVLQRAYVMMERQVGHLTRLVDDLLDVSRITRGLIELRRAPVSLTEAAEQAVEMATPIIDGRNHELSLTLPRKPLRVDGDGTRLTQVVFNLLNNAAKYTDMHGRIWLTVERDGDQAVVRVRDNGAGISPALLPKVFDLFTQGERTADRAQGGLGLGLALVKRLVEMHGGTVAARSDGLGKGSEFIVRLPALAPDADKPPLTLAPAPPAEVQVGRALVIDDNYDVAESITWIMEGLAHDIKMAHSGPAALQLVGEWRPDVIVCDIGMPGMDGYETCRRLRRLPGLEKVLIAAVSGYGSEEDRKKSHDAGFDRHLVKPVGRTQLEELVQSAVSGQPVVTAPGG